MRYKKFEAIGHTADAGIKAYGETKEEMFKNAARAMFNMLADLKEVKMRSSLDLEVTANNVEELLVAWLRELLYQSASKGVVFKEFSFEHFDDRRIRALCYGEKIDLKKGRFKVEIKAVTYHELEVKQEGSLWVGKVIFDM